MSEATDKVTKLEGHLYRLEQNLLESKTELESARKDVLIESLKAEIESLENNSYAIDV